MMISCLAVTCRPDWQKFLLHQYAKQTYARKQLIVFDDSLSPQKWPEHVTVIRGKLGSLGEKRQALLDTLRPEWAFAWFDDDDWHPACRLDVGAAMLEHVDVVGCRDGLFTDVVLHKTRRIETLDPVVFNGAVFGADCRLFKFQPLHRGEDTAWMQLVIKDARICSTPEMQHCWMSHETNVTGKRGSMSFEGKRFERFDSWELSFLEKFRR